MKIRFGRLAWSVFVALYLGLFFYNFFLTAADRWIPTVYVYVLVVWLSIEFYLRQAFFQSGRLIIEDPETKDRFDQMSFGLRSGFALFLYSCLGLGIADFVWLRKGQVSALAPYVNIIGILLLVVSVLVRLSADLGTLRRRSKVIREGLYSTVRHPAYFACALFVISIPFAFSSLYALIYSVLVGLPLVYLEAAYEDRYLSRKNGADYEKYRAGTSLFIPGIL